MKVKFEYECIHNKVDIFDFREELRAFCAFMMTESYHGPILENADRLYKDKAFVALVHKWAELNKTVEEANEHGLLFETITSERDSMSWLIADLI